MRIKLDENIPATAAAVARQLGHDADTVVAENLTGATGADVLEASARDERFWSHSIADSATFAHSRLVPTAGS